ncbi:MAG: type I DNA topoisomerase [Victivallaceae bacterium]|jgi:DNA topoisomerase-1
MAGNKLVIVESPTKAKTIGRMLGPEYTILASMGHVRDLPERSIGVDIKNHFAPMYVENPRSAKVVKEIKAAAKKADSVYLAPDPDREGEAIAWHLQELLKDTFKGKFQRVAFHEITKSAIEKAFQHTTEVNMNLVDSQQARRVLDRLVGYMVSPLLWSQVEKGASAGRVQSVALRLICEREREILAFLPEEFWNLSVQLQNKAGDEFESRLFKINDDKFRIGNENDALKAFNAIQQGKDFKIASVEFTPKTRNAPPPFTTSTLQQAANNLLKFSASNTMRIAQQLYEGIDVGAGGSAGLITYMRTDSVIVSKEAQIACRDFIAGAYGKEYLPGKSNLFKSKAGAQEAHEAIRPTDVTRTPESLAKYLDATQLRLYTLIWKRFVASQMAQVEQRQTTVDTDVKGADSKKYTFRATALVTVFPGFMKVYDVTKAEEGGEETAETPSEVLGRLKEGEACSLKKALKEQKFTEPPPRFTEASLIKELETNGIGRPSTYATIIQTIQTREYVAKDKGKLCPSELGFRVNDFLLAKLPDLIEVDFTSRMELHLDEVEEGKLGWTRMLDDFYSKFAKWLDTAKNAGSPEVSKAAALVNMLNQVKWAPAEKSGRRSYDDKKFFNSVREKFATDNKITARQWDALIGLAAKYSVQLPELHSVAAKHSFSNELATKSEEVKVSEERRLQNTATADDKSKYVQIFSAFSGVKWEPPQKNRGRVYDDKKFFDSLKKQADSGKTLSDKQLNVIARFATKYKDAIPTFETLTGLLGIVPEAGKSETDAAAPEASSETSTLLKVLAAVTEWEEPAQKGNRTFNDKTFYESLAKQAEGGKQLSPKQLFALKKMANKYSGNKEEE